MPGRSSSTGEPVAFGSPRDAIAAGLGMVHQHFALVASMTVTENVLIGLDRPRLRLGLDRQDAEVAALAEANGLRVDPQRPDLAALRGRAPAGRDPQGPLPRRAGPDHGRADGGPRAAGGGRPVPDAAVDDGRRAGAIVFISHKLGEVLAIADRITVMRRGRVTAAALPAAGVDQVAARDPDGRAATILESHERTPAADRATSCSSLDGRRGRQRQGARRRCAASRSRSAPGEIVGIAAVAGNGQSELAEVVTGLRACRGRVLVGGEDVANRPVRATIQRGVAHVPEDRHGVGSAPEPLARRQPDHEALPATSRSRAAGRSTSGRRGSSRPSSRTSYAISAPSIDTQARLLSGGNLQRVILAREIESEPAPDDRGPADPRPRRRRRGDGPPAAARAPRRPAPRSCSSPRSSTSCSRSPTGSRSCTRAGSWASWTPRTPTSPRSACS